MNLPINYDKASFSERRTARELYVEKQNGLCCHCGKSLNDKPDNQIIQMKINRNLFPPNFFKYPVHLHHDHETGMTIGAVHNYCNAVLWEYHGK